MESSSDSDQKINANMVFMAQIEKVLSDLEDSSSSADEKISKVLKDQLQVKYVVIDTHVDCQEKYAKHEAERYEYMIRYSAYFDNDKQQRKQIADQEVLYDKMSVQLVELDKHVIGLGYTLMFLTHFDEAWEIKNFKRSRENKIEFAYDNRNLNASYVNEKINFEDDYFQEIINPDFEKIDSPFQQTSSLKPYVPNVILEKIIIDLEDEVVNILEKEKANLEIIESLKSKGFESSENVISESENQSENDCLVVEKEYLLHGNNSYLGETSSAYVCNDAMNVSCTSRMFDLLDDNNFFIFDDESVRISPVSKMPFRKKPHDSMIVRSKSNMNKSLSRTVHKWLPKLQPLAEPVAKRFPRVKRCSKHMTGNRALLTNFVEKFLRTVRFGNNDFAVIAGYGDVVIESSRQRGILECLLDIQKTDAFRIYNKRTRKIHESVNVNFDEISEMASKQFSLEPGLSNKNETRKSSILSVSQVSEASKKDLEDLFQDFYDEYFDSSKIMKSSTTNAETSINEEVFHEVSELFQGESSSSSLNDDVQQSPEEVILPQTNTQSISNNMIPNVD
nr:integrase, catalytic region, zinc finger, CCHC-type, peptidase aspartic, catalytic [Tanacetum cinerariifolium]